MTSGVPMPLSAEFGTECDLDLRPSEKFFSSQLSATLDREASRRAAQRLTQLVQTIQSDVIPRLMLAHGSGPLKLDAVPEAVHAVGGECIERMTQLMLKPDGEAALGYVEELSSSGIPLESLLLDLLAPTARRLGELWTEDRCTFTDVTIGLSCLQQVLRVLSPAFEAEDAPTSLAYRILLVPSLGEHHTFGLFMVEEFFRRAKWEVWGGCAMDAQALRRIVCTEWMDVVGISASGTVHMEKLKREIRNVRKQSINKDLTVMVGGWAFAERPDLVALVGADCTAVDGKEAVMQALASVAAKRAHR